MTELASDLNMRRLVLEDAARAAALDARVMARPWSPAAWSSTLSQSQAFGHAVVCAGSLIGVTLLRAVADEAELLVLAVAPETRRRGVARALVQNGLHEARYRGSERVSLEVRADNAPALLLYRRLGFVDAGRRSGYYGSSPAGDALILVRSTGVDASMNAS
jgi:[ribosomal protein S18]-alanine N-acetyltransferase